MGDDIPSWLQDDEDNEDDGAFEVV